MGPSSPRAQAPGLSPGFLKHPERWGEGQGPGCREEAWVLGREGGGTSLGRAGKNYWPSLPGSKSPGCSAEAQALRVPRARG